MNDFVKCPRTGVMDITATAVSECSLQQVWSEGGKTVNKKKALSRSETRKLFKILKKKLKQSKKATRAVQKRAVRDLLMLSLALETALRGGDLMSLHVGHIFSSNGVIHMEFYVRQQKTKEIVKCAISRRTVKYLKMWQEYCSDSLSDYLFAGCGTDTYFSLRQYSRIIKQWASALNLAQEHYSTHSMRRSRAIMLFNKLKDIHVVKTVLGHASIQSTQEYLDNDVTKALAKAQRVPIF